MAACSALVAVLAVGLAGFFLWPRQDAVAAVPYSVDVGCMHFDAKTGRVPITLTVTNQLSAPLRFRGHIIVAIRRIQAGGSPAHNWVRYRYVHARTPLLTIPPGDAITWSTVKGPVLLHGRTAHLKAGGCTFYADPPRDR
jgi:hypothetical protein